MAPIVIDVMGSDHGLGVVVRGAAQLSVEQNPVSMLLVGDSEQIVSALRKTKYNPRYVRVVHASEYVKMDESPKVLYSKKDTSLQVAAQLIKSAEGSALVSAGNTGAVVLASAQAFNRLSGIRRAALAAVFPTELTHGPHKDPFSLILDVGATLHVEAEDLVRFALMGSAYAEIVSRNPTPKVALLSNGSEEGKGAPEVVEAHRMLKDHKGIFFGGNIEGMDIPKGTADVVVCEGFLGNVVLKMLEGFFEVVQNITEDTFSKKKLWRAGRKMLSEPLDQIRSLIDWEQYGGVPILGLEHVVIKAHGRSRERAIRNSIKVAHKSIQGDLIEKIRTSLNAAL